jgi:tetratricopeptide (TPR) repeat protein
VPSRDDCVLLARQGDPLAAERCFDRRASGSGLGAELALYEMARLRRDVLRDAAGALAAFGAYRDRFARGSLRSEVELSRVELLAELGRGRDALRDSAALLATSSGRVHGAELRLLRGDVYRQLGDLRGAAAEYAQVEALGGPRAAEASRARAACLEALGDVAGALAAYRRYASVPGRPHAADVAARIERLAGASRPR